MLKFDTLPSETANSDKSWRNNLQLPTDMGHEIKIKSESNPTSPHSMASDESYERPEANDNLYSTETIHSLMNRTNAPFLFDPITPPGTASPFAMHTAAAMQFPATPLNRFAITEMAFNSVGITPGQTPPKSPNSPLETKSQSGTSDKDGTEMESGSMSGDEARSLYAEYNEDITKPKYNSHGKMKMHRCKTCDFVATTRKDYWDHLRTHIKPERQIECSKCPFVTEFRHHYDYHLRNHEGSKPFKCPDCKYTCVNKSMLNSHLKSHSDVYQFRCGDCTYVTKYVHSLKLHLRKYEHRAGDPVDKAGQAIPVSVIDVYGTRRGPRAAAKSKAKPKKGKKSKQDDVPNVMASLSLDQLPQSLASPPPLLPPALSSPNHHMPQMAAHNLLPQSMSPQKAQASQLQNLITSQLLQSNPSLLYYLSATMQAQVLAQFAQQNKPADGDDDNESIGARMHDDHEIQPESPTSSGPHYAAISNSFLNKLNGTVDRQSPNRGMSHDHAHSAKRSTTRQSEHTAQPQDSAPDTSKLYNCKFCGIYYEDAIVHTIHMAHHGFNDTFMCNKCGVQCNDRVSFNMHIAQMQHP